MTRLDAQQESYPDEETLNRLNVARRIAYVRQHAPTILAGILADPNVTDFDLARSDAIESAGRIFDETEPVKFP